MSAPRLPDVAAAILKGLIVALATSGLVSQADAAKIITLLRLDDA